MKRTLDQVKQDIMAFYPAEAKTFKDMDSFTGCIVLDDSAEGGIICVTIDGTSKPMMVGVIRSKYNTGEIYNTKPDNSDTPPQEEIYRVRYLIKNMDDILKEKRKGINVKVVDEK